MIRFQVLVVIVWVKRLVKLWEMIISKKIILDFNSMSPFTSLFFNAMLEELISQGNIKVINDSLIIRNLSSLDIKTYKRCLNSAIQHQVKLDAD